MSAALTDKFRKGAPFFQTTLSGSMSDSDTTFTVASATGVPTDTAVDFVIDRIDQNGELLDPSLREVITGTVSGTTVTTDATRRGLDNTTAQAHTAGAVVEINFTSDTWNDHIDGILVSHEQDGSLKDDTVDTDQLVDEAVTTDKIEDDAVTEAKQAIKHSYSTSEVNTKVKWIDGSDIYSKTISIGALPNATTKSVAHGITGLSHIIKFEGWATATTFHIPLPNVETTANQCVSVVRNGTDIIIGAGTNRSSWTGYITIYYTK